MDCFVTVMMAKMFLISDLPCPIRDVQCPDTLMLFSQTMYKCSEALGLVIVLLHEQALAGQTRSPHMT